MSANQNKSIKIQNFEEFLKKCLNSPQLQLIDYTAIRMLPLGENYSSLILKIEAKVRKNKNGDEETLNFVAKTPTDLNFKITNWKNILEPEINMYVEMIPAYNEVDKALGFEEFKFYPKYIGHRYSLNDEDEDVEHSMLVLQNMISMGYYTENKSIGLNVEHAKVLLSYLARFHAIGMVLKKTKPDLIANRMKLLIEGKHDFQALDNGFDTILKTIRENECFKKHLPTVEKIFHESKNGKMFFKPFNEIWGTIVHNDVWVNNLLFHKDNEGRVDDVKFIDYQGCGYNSMLRDLPRLLCNSLDMDCQNNHMDELIDFYYETFIKWIKLYGYDSTECTKESFDEELKQQAINEFPLVAFCCKFLDVSVDVDDEEKRSTFAADVFAGKVTDRVIPRLQQVIKVYEKKKWLE